MGLYLWMISYLNKIVEIDPRPVFEYPKMTCRFETILVGAGTGWADEW